jgi:hypothetical protein
MRLNCIRRGVEKHADSAPHRQDDSGPGSRNPVTVIKVNGLKEPPGGACRHAFPDSLEADTVWARLQRHDSRTGNGLWSLYADLGEMR